MNKNVMLALLVCSLTACGGVVGPQGAAGPMGQVGQGGAPGINAEACNVTYIQPSTDYPYGGSLIQCPSSSSFVSNGANTPYTIVEIIDPCGNTVAGHEVFFRFASGDVVASFSDNEQGNYTRFSKLYDGSFETTDHTGCTFTLSTDEASNTRTMTFNNGTSESWDLPGGLNTNIGS